MWVDKEEKCPMFLGMSVHNLDDKGRLTLPTKDRSAFTNAIVYAAMGFDGDIDLYPEADYRRMSDRYDSLDDFDENSRLLKRLFYSSSEQMVIDGHGRIQLPKSLISKAGIKKSVTFVGRGSHIEIWDTERYEEIRKKGEDGYSCLAQKAFQSSR